jgi:hypothetical protein
MGSSPEDGFDKPVHPLELPALRRRTFPIVRASTSPHVAAGLAAGLAADLAAGLLARWLWCVTLPTAFSRAGSGA